MSLMYKLFWEKPTSENLHSAGIDNILFPQGWSYESNLKRIIEPHEAIPIFYEITNFGITVTNFIPFLDAQEF